MSVSDKHAAAIDVAQVMSQWSDSYFGRSKQIVEQYGDVTVTQAVFMRRPVVFAPKMAFSWLKNVEAQSGHKIDIKAYFEEGQWVGAGTPMFTITGSLALLLQCETQLLQRIGPPCVAAYNAYTMCASLPEVAFLAMEARHCAGLEMSAMMSYAAHVGGTRAVRKSGAKGFIGGSCHATAEFFGQAQGLGTMPHSLVGYAGSTLRAAEMFHATFPDQPMTVLVDYFGREIDDALAVARAFSELVQSDRLSVRLDTHGGRFLQGLDTSKSYAVLEHYAPNAIKGYCTEVELKHMIGTGVSAAAIWRMREALNEAGFERINIVGSSGFNPQKCRVMALTGAPLDTIGTGSFTPECWSETNATCDVIAFAGQPLTKVGREFLREALLQRNPVA